MTNLECPHCKSTIKFSYVSRIFWEMVSDFDGISFEAECPTCDLIFVAEVIPSPDFKLHTLLQWREA